MGDVSSRRLLLIALCTAVACASENRSRSSDPLSMWWLGTVPLETVADLPLDAMRERDRMTGSVTLEENYTADPPCIVGREEQELYYEFIERRVELERVGERPEDFRIEAIVATPYWRSERFPRHEPFAKEQERLNLTVGELAWGSPDGGFLWATSRTNLYVQLALEPADSTDGDGSDSRTITGVVAVFRREWLLKHGYVTLGELKQKLDDDPQAAARCASAIRTAIELGAEAARELREAVVWHHRSEMARLADAAEEEFHGTRSFGRRCAIHAELNDVLDQLCAGAAYPLRSGAVVEAMRSELLAEHERGRDDAHTAGQRYRSAAHAVCYDLVMTTTMRPSAAVDADGIDAMFRVARELDALPVAARVSAFARLQDDLAADASPDAQRAVGMVRRLLIADLADAALAAEAAGLEATAAGHWLLRHTLLRGRALDRVLRDGILSHLVLPGKSALAQLPARASADDGSAESALLRARIATAAVIARLVPFTSRAVGSDDDKGRLAGGGADRLLALRLGEAAQRRAWIERVGADVLELEFSTPDVTVTRAADSTVMARKTIHEFHAGTNVGAVAEWRRRVEELTQQIVALDRSIDLNREAASTPTAMHGFTSLRYLRGDHTETVYEVVKDTERLSSILGRLEALRDAEAQEAEREQLIARYEHLCRERPHETPANVVVRVVEYPTEWQNWNLEVVANARLHGGRTDYAHRGRCSLKDRRVRIAANPALGIAARDDWTTEATVRSSLSRTNWQADLETLACDGLFAKRRAELATELAAAGRNRAEIEAERRWANWLLCDPERTEDAVARDDARGQERIVELVLGAAQQTRGGTPGVTCFRLSGRKDDGDDAADRAAMVAAVERIGRGDPDSAAEYVRWFLVRNASDAGAWRLLARYELVAHRYRDAQLAFQREDAAQPSKVARYLGAVMAYWQDLAAERRSDVSWRRVIELAVAMSSSEAREVRAFEHEISQHHRYFNGTGLKSHDLIRNLRD